ncbi:MAG TPA: tyrosine-type recombinase/integrase [Candidatus Omnitrophota bacterium]|nr:tyrosine-type recombinase/integrase [Candidatus Omnitrophota bacterium]
MAKGHIVRRGKVWYARFYDGTGHRQWQSLKTNSREIAQAKFAKVIQAIEKHEVGWRLKGKLVSEYLAEYLALCEAEHSKRTYRVEKQILEEFTGFSGAQYLHQIAADKVEAYKVKRSKTVKKSTVNRTVTAIKSFLNRAVQLGYLEKNPAQFVKKLKEEQTQIKHLGDDEVKKLLKVCSPRVKQIVTLFLLTGMRLGELAHLRWKDVDFRHNLIHIQNQPDWTTKSYKPRVIPVHPVARKMLEELSQKKLQGYVFQTSSGKTIESYIRAEILRYAKKAKVSANVKMFRSTFASNLVMSGVDIYTVSKLLGHYDVKITEKHYAHLTPDFLSHSVSRLSFLPQQTSKKNSKRISNASMSKMNMDDV